MRITFMLLVSLLAACGNDSSGTTAASGASDAARASVPLAASATIATPSVAETTASDTSANPEDEAVAGGDAAVTPAAASGPSTAARLPLPLGFYVSADTPCAQASNATLQLLRRDGMNTSHVQCDFTRVEKVGATSYRVTERCADDGEAFGRETEVSTSTSTYEVDGPNSFRIVGEGGDYALRHCPQPSLPEPWRDNDISDIIG